MERLTKRRDYLFVAKGERLGRVGFLLQFRVRGDEAAPRFGFTVTKKTGNAVVRNRIRRRLREAVRLAGNAVGHKGVDYVLIGRPPALHQPFAVLLNDVAGAVRSAGRRLRVKEEPGRQEEKESISPEGRAAFRLGNTKDER